MTVPAVTYERASDHVGQLTLRRPEARNTMSAELLEVFAQGVAAARGDGRLRCLVVTGEAGEFHDVDAARELGCELMGQRHRECRLADAVRAEHRPEFTGPDGQVEVADYGQSGSDELAENVVKALGQRAGPFAEAIAQQMK